MDARKLDKKDLEQLSRRKLHILNPPKQYKKEVKGAHYESPQLICIVNDYSEIKFKTILQKTRYSTICFHARRHSANKTAECIYGFLYVLYEELQPEYICIGHTYNSKDGEYRRRFTKYNVFMHSYEKNLELMDKIEQNVISLIESGELELFVDFYTESDVDLTPLNDLVNNNILMIKLYAVNWLIHYYQIKNSSISPNSTESYQFVLNHGNDVYEQLMESIGLLEIKEIIHVDFTRLYKKVKTTLGQKLIPLTFKDTTNVEDINLIPWKELYFNMLCTDLILNFVSPSFPLINNWFFVYDSRKELFDNTAMQQKFKYSTVANSILESLRVATKQTAKDTIPINKRFADVERKIANPIEYINTYLRLSNLSISIVNEYAGRTIFDMHSFVKNNENINPVYKNVFRDYRLYVFDYIYGFYCMNRIYKMIHADIHLNNITLYKKHNLVYPYDKVSNTWSKAYEDVFNLFIIDEDLSFLVPATGMHGVIIDFSRSMTSQLSSKTQLKSYMKKQYDYILALINRYFPNIVREYENRIKALLFDRFPLMLKIMSAIDPLTLSFHLKNTLTKLIPNQDITYIDRIYRQTRHLLQINLEKAINGDIFREEDIEWPTKTILIEQFSDFIYSPGLIKRWKQWDKEDKEKIPGIIDIYNSQTELKYSINGQENWPDILTWYFDKRPNDAEYKIFLDYDDDEENKKIEEIAQEYEIENSDISEVSTWQL